MSPKVNDLAAAGANCGTIFEHGTMMTVDYTQFCPVARTLDLIGDRWALLVMRELFWGPKRFSDLRADLPGISANVLTQRRGEIATGLLPQWLTGYEFLFTAPFDAATLRAHAF